MSAAELDPGPEVSRWQEFPEIPVCDGGILEGFEEFMDFTPHASAESFAAHGFAPSLSEPEFRAGAEAAEAHPGPVSSARRTVAESRQFKNRMSQARFRRKKKVRSRFHRAPGSDKLIAGQQ